MIHSTIMHGFLLSIGMLLGSLVFLFVVGGIVIVYYVLTSSKFERIKPCRRDDDGD